MTKLLNSIRALVSSVDHVAASQSSTRSKSPSVRKSAPRRRATSKHSSTRPAKRRVGSSGKGKSNQRTLFHTPSFSAGVILGAVIVLITAYTPEILSGPFLSGLLSTESRQTGSRQTESIQTGSIQTGSIQTGSKSSEAAHPPSSDVTFQFDNLLRNSQVTADPDAYQMQGQTEEPGSIEYIIQAASFRHEAEAETLRAQLLLQDLPANTTSTSLDSSVWYRVTVGPFDSQVMAQRALTRLREQNLDALYIRRRKPT